MGCRYFDVPRADLSGRGWSIEAAPQVGDLPNQVAVLLGFMKSKVGLALTPSAQAATKNAANIRWMRIA